MYYATRRSERKAMSIDQGSGLGSFVTSTDPQVMSPHGSSLTMGGGPPTFTTPSSSAMAIEPQIEPSPQLTLQNTLPNTLQNTTMSTPTNPDMISARSSPQSSPETRCRAYFSWQVLFREIVHHAWGQVPREADFIYKGKCQGDFNTTSGWHG